MDRLARGLYEQLVTGALDRELGLLDGGLVVRESIDPAEAHQVLSRHLADLARRALASVSGGDGTTLERQVGIANEIAQAILKAAPKVNVPDDLVHESAEQLLEILERSGLPSPPTTISRPNIPLSTSALLVNGRDQPRIGTEVQRELESADRVDLLCAFVKWHGL